MRAELIDFCRSNCEKGFGDTTNLSGNIKLYEYGSKKRVMLAVLGMHRSGTSAVTRILSLLGADLPIHLLGGNASNEPGHWESTRLIQIHDEMLAEGGSSWNDWRDWSGCYGSNGWSDCYGCRSDGWNGCNDSSGRSGNYGDYDDCDGQRARLVPLRSQPE